MTLTKVTYSMIDGAPINVKDFGAVGNGIANDTAAIQAAIDAVDARGGGAIVFDLGDYNLGSGTLSWAASNVHVMGIPGGTTIRSTAISVLNFTGNCSNVVFEDILFVSDRASSTPSSEGTILSAQRTLSNITFLRGGASAPNSNQNAVKMVADVDAAGPPTLDRISFIDFAVNGAGRMGIELQNHDDTNTGNTTPTITNVQIIGGYIHDTGTLNTAGMGISLSGYGEGAIVDGVRFARNEFCCVENVGFSRSFFLNLTMDESGSNTSPLSFTNFRLMEDNVIDNFQCREQAAGNVVLRNQLRLKMKHNKFDLAGNMDFRGCVKLLSVEDSYICGGVYGIYCQDDISAPPTPAGQPKNTTSEDNVWVSTEVDCINNPGDPLFAIVRFVTAGGSGTFENAMINPVLWQRDNGSGGVSGVPFENAASARDNYILGTVRLNGGYDMRAALNFTTDASIDLTTAPAAEYLISLPVMALTSSVSLSATRTLTIPTQGPIPIRIYNGTTGGQDIIISGGAGSTATVPNGQSRTVISKGRNPSTGLSNGLDAYP